MALILMEDDQLTYSRGHKREFLRKQLLKGPFKTIQMNPIQFNSLFNYEQRDD